jgi:hypothetical protein
MSRLIRSITLALALLVLCSSAMYAFPSSERLTREGFLAALWNQVVAWFAPSAAVSVQEKEGSQMDPNGLPTDTTFSEGLEIEAGRSVDLNGNR